MAELFDRLCRILATPMPRSRALKLILGGLAGAVLTPFAFGQRGCPPQRVCAGGAPGDCCPPGQKCCPGPNHCCPNNSTCCGGNSCCSSGQTCCGNSCCSSGQTCCRNSICCPSGQTCCGTPSPAHCCPNPQTCCGNSCCTPSQTCVNGVCQGGPSPGQPD